MVVDRKLNIRQNLIQFLNDDFNHGYPHADRVWSNIQQMLAMDEVLRELVSETVLFFSCYLHDCVCLPKDDPNSSMSSQLAADKAISIVEEMRVSKNLYPNIHHSILTHSFSAGHEPQTLEAKLLSDADKLDAIGAIGIFRWLTISGEMGKPYMSPDDPFCDNRQPNDKEFALDHYYTKLRRLSQIMQTNAGRKLALERQSFMAKFIKQLRDECQLNSVAIIKSNMY